VASVTVENRNGRTLYRIEYRDSDKRRRKIRLGAIAKRDALAIAAKVDDLVSATISGSGPSPALAEWVNKIGDDLHSKLSEQGLCKPRNNYTLKEWLDLFMAQHEKNIGEHTRKALARSQVLIEQRFGKDIFLKNVTPEDAQSFREWLVNDCGLAQPTVAKVIKHAKQFFNAALSNGILDKSPFAEVVAGTQANDERSVYVPVEDVERAIGMAPDAQWRLIIALCRYAGLRCSSEVLRLSWADVDFVSNTLTVYSTKTAKQGKAKRVVPILPELRPHLEDAFNPEDERCISRYRLSNSNLHKMFLQILAKAGLKPWPRLFHNLRGSLETDLIERHPAHAVVKWLGNSERVALKHYLKVTPKHLSDAASQGVGQQVGTNLAESTSKQRKPFPSSTTKTRKSDKTQGKEKGLIGRAGLEPATKGL
jgi:integrase